MERTSSIRRKATARQRKGEVMIAGEQLRLRLHDGKLIKDRRYHLRTYPNCFVAQELIDWLVSHKEAPDRATAVRLMQHLMDHDILHHVCDKRPRFKDAKLLYRFRKDDGTFPFNREVKIFARGQRLYEHLIGDKKSILQLREEHGVAYQRSFPGGQLIDWLLQNGEAESRRRGLELCRALQEHGIIQHGEGSPHPAPLMSGTGNERAVRGRCQWAASRETANTTRRLFVKDSIHHQKRFSLLLPLSLSLSLFPLPPLVAKKYEFFDSGLLYQFCINFRRRRRLSELLRESEQDDDKVSTQEDSRGDSPSVRHKSSPQEGDNAFQSVRVSKDLTSVTGGRRGSSNSAQLQSSGFPLLVQLSSSSVRCNPESVLRRHFTCEELFAPGAPLIKKVLTVIGDALGWGFVVRGMAPCYVQAVDPESPSAASGVKVRQFVCQVNGQCVLYLNYRTVTRLVMTGPRTIVLEVLEPLE
uniref:DEP domain-containing mTOR-interacting protein isoform X2 n=1 Tax=Gasterosteus aculeatus aculeatus TaxID=481459 RepID=UPI001A994F81|nr:DEP domain-containing mTOR-interacting protein isoform X2 [Gasterosteus aculeatus aculeatus]